MYTKAKTIFGLKIGIVRFGLGFILLAIVHFYNLGDGNKVPTNRKTLNTYEPLGCNGSFLIKKRK
jgi:hypothetical protein